MMATLVTICGYLVLAQMGAGEGAPTGPAPMGNPPAAAPMAGEGAPMAGEGERKAGGENEGGGGLFGGGYMMPLLFLAFFAFMYFAMIRPQQQRQSERAEMLNNLKVNDKVYTNGGILGTITNIAKEDDEVEIRVDEKTNTKLRVLRSCIAGLDNEKSRAEADE